MKIITTLLVICLSKTYSEIKIAGCTCELEKFEKELADLLSEVLLGNIDPSNKKILNGYVDRMFGHLKFVVKDNFNNITLPTENFQNSHRSSDGTIMSGSLTELSDFHRGENVSTFFNGEEKKITLKLPFHFDNLKFKYYFYITGSWFFEAYGDLYGTLKDARFLFTVTFDYTSQNFTMNYFHIKNQGVISVQITGESVKDWLYTALSDEATSIIHPHIMNEMQNKIGNGLQNLVQRLNEDIHQKLKPNV